MDNDKPEFELLIISREVDATRTTSEVRCGEMHTPVPIIRTGQQSQRRGILSCIDQSID